MNSKYATRRGRRGFVTLDLIWILLLLVLALVLSIDGIELVEKRENADRMVRELEAIAEAVALAAERDGLEPGARVEFAQYAAFLSKQLPKRLREEGEDPLGNPYGAQHVGGDPSIDPQSAAELDRYWR